jgi:hypothetical protein
VAGGVLEQRIHRSASLPEPPVLASQNRISELLERGS